MVPCDLLNLFRPGTIIGLEYEQKGLSVSSHSCRRKNLTVAGVDGYGDFCRSITANIIDYRCEDGRLLSAVRKLRDNVKPQFPSQQ
jgi:hypothetical protein